MSLATDGQDGNGLQLGNVGPTFSSLWLSVLRLPLFLPPPRGGDTARKFGCVCVCVCGALFETLTLFQIKICDFPYPISDLIQNWTPYFRPVQEVFQFA